MKEMKKTNIWIVAICNSEGDGIDIDAVDGTKEQIKEYLVSLVKSYDEDYECNFEGGVPEGPEDIQDKGDYLYAGPWSYDYHIDFAAHRLEPLVKPLMP